MQARSRPVEYGLTLGAHHQPMNELIGKSIQLEFIGKIHCQARGERQRASHKATATLAFNPLPNAISA